MKAHTYTGAALDEQARQMRVDEIDPDLAWVEREIARCEDGPRSVFQDTPELARIRNERLARLKALRARLLGEEPA